MKNGIYILLIAMIACRQNKITIIPPVHKNIETVRVKTTGGVTYCNEQLFSGWLFRLNEKGDTILLQPYMNGKLNGKAEQWYVKNQLMEERFYVNGRKEGTHKGYWENGQLKFEYHFMNDEHEGLQKEWYADGKVFRLMNYHLGHETGLQKMYRTDGAYIFNYEVKDGRMYGLTGTKNCKNVGESITRN